MGYQSSHMPGTIPNTISPIATNLIDTNGSKSFTGPLSSSNSGAPSGEDNDNALNLKMPKRQNTGRRHVRQYSITSTTMANERKIRDTARFILLQKTAIETIGKNKSITKFIADTVAYMEQVGKIREAFSSLHDFYF